MLELDEAARRQVAEIRTAETIAAELKLRIKVIGGGCAGFTYDMYFDRQAPDDTAIAIGAETVLIDPATRPYLEGTTIGHEPHGFTFDNPRAKAHCKCGASFRLFTT